MSAKKPWKDLPKPRTKVRIRQASELRSRLRKVIDEAFLGSASSAARFAELSQPTVSRILRGQEVVLATTLSGLRKLIRPASERAWNRLILGDDLQRVRIVYERVVRAELNATVRGSGLVRGTLQPAAELEIQKFVRWASVKGHHVERIRLAEWRVRGPTVLSLLGAPWEFPDHPLDQLALIRLGIRREKMLLARLPPFLT